MYPQKVNNIARSTVCTRIKYRASYRKHISALQRCIPLRHKNNILFSNTREGVGATHVVNGIFYAFSCRWRYRFARKFISPQFVRACLLRDIVRIKSNIRDRFDEEKKIKYVAIPINHWCAWRAFFLYYFSSALSRRYVLRDNVMIRVRLIFKIDQYAQCYKRKFVGTFGDRAVWAFYDVPKIKLIFHNVTDVEHKTIQSCGQCDDVPRYIVIAQQI